MKYLILLLSFNVMAHDYRYQPEPMQVNDDSKAIALALATWHPFSNNTEKWQGSVNGATYDGETAISIAIAKRFKGIDALLHSSYGQNNGKDSITFGLVTQF